MSAARGERIVRTSFPADDAQAYLDAIERIVISQVRWRGVRNERPYRALQANAAFADYNDAWKQLRAMIEHRS